MKSQPDEITFAAKVLQGLIQSGVREWVVCAGSRNAPLVGILCESPDLIVHSHPEERSAAFFALGRMKALGGAPVAVVTTSGTASAELLPAMIEAYYSGLPLVALTADRPTRFEGTGAPQTIQQKNLFGIYAAWSLDLDVGSQVQFPPVATQPVHINVRFEEPALPPLLPKLKQGSFETPKSAVVEQGPFFESKHLETWLQSHPNALVILGEIPRQHRDGVVSFLQTLKAPVWAEPLSGLREDPRLESCLLRSGERILKSVECDGVLRIGRIPVGRFWRDLEIQNHQHLPVLHVSDLHFTGLTRGVCLGYSALQNIAVTPFSNQMWLQKLRERDRLVESKIRDLLAAEPLSEPAWVNHLSRVIEPETALFLGNSLPIREWDLFAQRQRNKNVEVYANRGANGIDGEVSTFLGTVSGDDSKRPHAAILGDLTALYDLMGLWSLRDFSGEEMWTLYILNNQGGTIFRRVKSWAHLSTPQRLHYVENRHQLSFESWAQMFRVSYDRWTSRGSVTSAAPVGIVEICPDPESTERFWNAYDKLPWMLESSFQ